MVDFNKPADFVVIISIFIFNLHFSPGFLLLHNNIATTTAIRRRTMEAPIIVTMMITLDVAILFNKPTPIQKQP